MTRKIGLALGGGVARGLAHIGVLEVLERENIHIDMVAGTSIGAIIGALYATGKSVAEIHSIAIDLSRKTMSLVDFSLPTSGIIKGNKIVDLLKTALGGDIRFDDLKIPFACVAADINTGEEIIFDRGPVADAVRASIAIPAVFTASHWNERYLVDGGLVEPVPVNTARQMGADFVIGVNVIPHLTVRTEKSKKSTVPQEKEPGMVHTIIQSLYIATFSLVKISLESADIIIEPEVSRFSNVDFPRVEELVSEGRDATLKAMPEIKKALRPPDNRKGSS